MAPRDGLFRALVLLGALTLPAFLVIVLAVLLPEGAGALSLPFLVEAPREAGRSGGIGPVLLSTLALLAVCLAAGVAPGLALAVYLAEEEGGRGAAWVRGALEVLAGVPSIVLGLFGAAFFGRVLGLGYSLLAGGLTLACMTLPFFARTAEEGLRRVPRSARLAAAALGLSRWTTVVRVLLPQAAPMVAAAVVLSLARALAETAALLFTSGYVLRMPHSLLDPGRALSVHVFDLAMNVPGGADRAAASALVLLFAVLAADGAVAASARRARLVVGAGP